MKRVNKFAWILPREGPLFTSRPSYPIFNERPQSAVTSLLKAIFLWGSLSTNYKCLPPSSAFTSPPLSFAAPPSHLAPISQPALEPSFSITPHHAPSPPPCATPTPEKIPSTKTASTLKLANTPNRPPTMKAPGSRARRLIQASRIRKRRRM